MGRKVCCLGVVSKNGQEERKGNVLPSGWRARNKVKRAVFAKVACPVAFNWLYSVCRDMRRQTEDG
jgi:hypothetical protein